LFIAVFGRKIKKHFYKNVLNIMRCFSVIQVAGQFSTMLALRQASPLPPSWPFAAKLALCRQDGPLPPGRFQLLITILTASVLNCQQQQRLSTCPLRRWQQC
jgi:hypothetical protein